MKLGFLGGGQLALMLTDAAHKLGHTVIVLCREDDPAVRLADEVVVGALRDPDAIEDLFRKVDVVTIENELVDVGLIRELELKYPQVRFLPTSMSVAIAQDKLVQKRLFERCGFQTAPYLELSADIAPSRLIKATQDLGGEVVLKWSRGGYDGRGVLPWRLGDDLRPAIDFWRRGSEHGAIVFAEAKVALQGEAALVTVRHTSGELASWPLMFTRQYEGSCREVYGPAVQMGLHEARETQARDVARALGNELGFCGVFALEFFLTRSGLLINEMAPRVHNSGHFTLNDEKESQFTAHIRAVTGAPLVQPSLTGLAYMRNVLGPARREFDMDEPPNVTAPDGAALHWYGKRRCKPTRKMGHLTGRCASVAALLTLREQACYWELEFWSKTAE